MNTPSRLLISALCLAGLAPSILHAQSQSSQPSRPQLTVYATDQAPLTPLKERLSDKRVLADIDKMVELHLRIDRLGNSDHPKRAYHQAQAYTWLEMARTEYLDKNEQGLESTAYTKALQIVQSLERKQDPQMPEVVSGNRYYAAQEKAIQEAHSNPDVLQNNLAHAGRQEVLLAWAKELEEMNPNFHEGCPKFDDLQPNYAAGSGGAVGGNTLRIYDIPNNIHFALDEYYLSPASKQILDKLAAVMQAQGDLKIKAVGHTDPRASDLYNQRLSERRAEVAKRYLVEQKGIAADRIEAVGASENQLLTEEMNALGHAKNRRTQFEVINGLLLENSSFRILRDEADLQIENMGESRDAKDRANRLKNKTQKK